MDIEVSADLTVDGCREGYRMASGVLPYAGERVLLSAMAGAQFVRDRWFVAETVADAYQPGWCYLSGYYPVDRDRAREYVYIPGLRVERLMAPVPRPGRHRI